MQLLHTNNFTDREKRSIELNGLPVDNSRVGTRAIDEEHDFERAYLVHVVLEATRLDIREPRHTVCPMRMTSSS